MLFSSPSAAAEDGHAPRTGGEGDGGLPGRVAGPDDVHVQPVRVPRLVARRSVVDALAGEAVEALDRQPPPGYAAGEDDRPRAQDVTPVQLHPAGCRCRFA